MKIEFDSFSHTGPRPTNDDRLLPPIGCDNIKIMIAIADGIGGTLGGGEAATIAISEACKVGPAPERFIHLFSQAVDAIKTKCASNSDLSRMGTTLSVAAIFDSHIHVAHVGDTRIYHLRGNGVQTLTQDQTEIAELMRKGVFTSKQARRYPRRNVLTSALTAEAHYEVYLNSAELMPKDRIVLTSDGVHQKVMRKSMLSASLANQDIHGFVREMERKVIEAEPSDNYTLLALEIVEV